MNRAEILDVYTRTQCQNPNSLLNFSPTKNPLFNHSNIRPLSVSVEDAFFGDSGKGAVTAKYNRDLLRYGRVNSLKPNGSANAGHEEVIGTVKVVTNQIPVGSLIENGTGIIGRGMVYSPTDGKTELEKLKSQFGGSLPGTLLTDTKTPLSLNSHRALEYAINQYASGGNGSTGTGVTPAYMDFYGRMDVTVEDLLSKDWKKLMIERWNFHKMLINGLKLDMEDIPIRRLGEKEKRCLGSEAEFLDELSVARDALRPYACDTMYDFLTEAWESTQPFTIEWAQGAGLDPYHGVRNDVTSSRPMSRFITDSTYGIIEPNSIAIRVAAMKTTYMSSVGQRKLPEGNDPERDKWIQTAFDETGRTTGRLRDVYPVSIPIGQYLRRAAGYEYLVATHLDAAREGENFEVVVAYHDKITGKEKPYLPYQTELDKLEAETVTFKGWDGDAAKTIKDPQKLPYEAKMYLAFLSRTIAPVVMATTGPEEASYISFVPNF